MHTQYNYKEVEDKLSLIWKEILKEEEIDRDTSFFDIGGNSFNLIKLLSAINNEFKKNITLNKLITYSTIASQSLLILNYNNRNNLFADNEQILFYNEFDESRQNLFFIHDGTGEVGGYNYFWYNLGNTFNIIAISANWKKQKAPQCFDINKIAYEYVNFLKVIQENKVYFLAGWSAGGVIAFEMANILEQDGEDVKLFFFDVPHPISDQPFQSFSFQSELKIITDIYKKEISEITLKSGDINLLWDEFLNNLDFELNDNFAQILEKYIKVLPDLKNHSNYEKVCKINYMRSVISSVMAFNPKDKLLSDMIYFQPIISDYNIDVWQKYFYSTIKKAETFGDHFSMFSQQNALVLSEIFIEKAYE